MSTLTHLDVGSIPELGLLLKNNKDLTFLKMHDCKKLMISPDELHNLVTLKFLTIVNCPNLTSMVSIQGLTSLQDLNIQSCAEMTNFPIGLGSCSSLRHLYVEECANLIYVAEEDLIELKSLCSLTIYDCKNLKHFPLVERFLHCLPRLEKLSIGKFSNELDSFPSIFSDDNIQQLPQLRDLRLTGWSKLKSLPDQIQHFTALRSLTLFQFEELEVLLG